MNTIVGIILIIVVLCISLVSIFFLAQRFFGGTKPEERLGLKRSIMGILWVFGIVFVLPSLINLVSSFFHNVIWGSMTLKEYLRHIVEFSFQATYNFYVDLLAKLSKF